MAKPAKPSRGAQTKAALVAETEKKLEEALAVQANAKAALDAAGSPDDANDEKAALKRADDEVDRLRKALDALATANTAKPPAATDATKRPAPAAAAANAKAATGDRQTFVARESIRMDGKRYAPGDQIALDRVTYDQLKPIGHIEGDWPG